MTFESLLPQMGMGGKHLTDRYSDYGAPIAEQQHVFYSYEAPAQGHSEASSKHNYGGGHKSNAAMSALTLLAFLFFLHILQQCIKDHMASMSTPQIAIMTAGREGETAVKKADAKIDKSGFTDDSNKKTIENDLEEIAENKHLTKIYTAEPPRAYGKRYNNAHKSYEDRIAQSDFVSAMDEK